MDKKDLELERGIKCQVDYATHFWPEGKARKQETSGIVGGWNLYNIRGLRFVTAQVPV